MHRDHFRWCIPVLGFLLCALFFMSAARFMLMMWQLDRVTAVDGFCNIQRPRTV